MKRHLVLIAVFIIITAPAWGDTFTVPVPYPTIQSAVDAASSGDLILIDAGVYSDITHTVPPDTTRSVVIPISGITIRGAGAGLTIIDPLHQGRGINCEGVTDVVIEDLTVTDAFAQVYAPGILIRNNSTATINNCDVSNNDDGGIIVYGFSTAYINDCTINENVAKQGGGLAVEEDSYAEVTGCELSRNISPSGGGLLIKARSTGIISFCEINENEIDFPNGSGGGINVITSDLTLLDSEVMNNTSDGTGGGIACRDESTLDLQRCRIHGNSTTAAYGPGGGLFADYSSLTMVDCLVTRNEVEGDGSEGGGLFCLLASPISITQCTFAANKIWEEEENFGGGIYLDFTSPTITKSIIANNDGYGIYCYNGSVPVVSCTDIYGNLDDNSICGTDAGDNFSLDPLFCDMPTDNFGIETTSPCAAGNHPNGGGACNGDRLGARDAGCTDSVEEGGVVTGLFLANRPNPFRTTTTVHFQLNKAGAVGLRIVDVTGRQVRSLVNRSLPAGMHTSVWDAKDDAGDPVASGVYFYLLTTNGETQTRRMVYAR
ncbi:MAG: right-handed parallel beta-helix repeat-containing protein, partial [Candidatus Eisenbacteria bacterium]|nr:right-handed parallel beta-helix repeat-containing protein [Candidatus Eisenbacteria bacterium]